MNLKTPGVSKEILDWLDALYPDRAPSPKATDREIWMAVGAVDVVRKLRSAYERQLAAEFKGVG